MGNHYSSLNFNLGETVDMLRTQIQQFVKAEITPVADQTDKENSFRFGKSLARWVYWA